LERKNIILQKQINERKTENNNLTQKVFKVYEKATEQIHTEKLSIAN